jgi:hypothetical protein
VLDHEARLVDALKVGKRSKAESAKGLAAKDDFSACFLAESHL